MIIGIVYCLQLSIEDGLSPKLPWSSRYILPICHLLVFDITMNPHHEFVIRGSALELVEAFKYLGCLLAQDDDARDCKPGEFKSPLGLLTVACGNWIKLSSGGWNLVGRLTTEFKGVLFS
jgi:hypothetical protein